ncbi:trace amine-associated receptor 4-like [Amphiura filiformis]|uniref:trace amine-associated receptor 4-like n=1 Tax=Amphiura filiformis TaxID=82378 RepID=UPI003B21BF9A
MATPINQTDLLWINSSASPGASGPEFTPKTVAQLSLASTKIFIGIIGLMGNFSVCLVIAKMRSSHQQNSTNRLIVSQAVIDFLASLVLIATTFSELYPSPLPQNPVLGYLYCVLWHPRTCMWTMFVISTYNLVAISLERYVAVVYSTWFRHHFSRNTTIIFIAVAWCVAPLLQLTLAFTQYSLGNGKCILLFPSVGKKAATGVALFLWNFTIPCLIMAFSFTRIAVKIRQQKKRVGKSETARNQLSIDDQSKRQPSKKHVRNVTKTLAFVFLMYVICWAPDQLLFLQFNLGGYINFGGVLHSFVIILAMLNSACNPFIYTLQYKHYKYCLKSLFKFN